jgi:hypothetical protein
VRFAYISLEAVPMLGTVVCNNYRRCNVWGGEGAGEAMCFLARK